MLKRLIHKFIWIYGTCRVNDWVKRARKHRFNKNVQFLFRKAGWEGRKEDLWMDFNSYWWPNFVADKNNTNAQPTTIE